MKKTSVKKIEKYLLALPEDLGPQVINFVGYLSYINQVDSDQPYPDEKRAIDRYRKSKHLKTVSWDQFKKQLD